MPSIAYNRLSWSSCSEKRTKERSKSAGDRKKATGGAISKCHVRGPPTPLTNTVQTAATALGPLPPSLPLAAQVFSPSP